MTRTAPLFVVLFLVAACGGSEPAKPTPAPAEAESDSGSLRQTYAPELGTGSIRGTVRFEGAAPVRVQLDMSSDGYCENCYGKDAPPLSETTVVGADGALANVFVQVSPADLRRWKFPKGTATREIDQQGCRYLPHVLAAQVGDTLAITNGDATMHNIHSTDEASKDWFNQGQPNKGDVYRTSVDRGGVFKLKCDVHGWMSAWICVATHPLFAVTGEDGAFSIPGVPPGEYTVVAWHEKFGTREATVTVGDGATADTVFTFTK